MGYVEIREQIKVILGSVTGVSDTNLKVGVVHDYMRWSDDWGMFLDHFRDPGGVINGCMFNRINTPERRLTVPTPNLRSLIWRIIYIRGLNDEEATERKFQDVVEGICTKFRTERNINSTCDTIEPEFGPMAGLYGVQIDTIENRIIGSVLCHWAEMRLCTQYREGRV